MNIFLSKPRHRKFQKRRAFTLIEVLVAALIVGLCMAGMISIWYFSYNLSLKTDRLGLAYSIARASMEQAKQTGFAFTSVGTTTKYYDNTGQREAASQTADHSFYVTKTVTAGTVGAGTDGLLLVKVEVFQIPTNTSLYKTQSYFTKAGI